MTDQRKFRIAFLLAFSIIIVWKNYVIVIGQTPPKPVLVALNKTDATLAIIDPKEMKVIGKVPTGDAPPSS